MTKVIVRLAVDVSAGEAAIADAQARLLNDLAPYRVQLVHRYATLPMLALAVDRQALQWLQRSERVVDVSPDACLQTVP